MSDSKQVGKRLVELCRELKNLQALDELYADDVVSIEAVGHEPALPKVARGKAAVRQKNVTWFENHTVHGGSTSDPMPHDDRFIVEFDFDVTPKVGPNAGKRLKLHETALYTVAGGKIVKEEFFYDLG